jgi:DNA-binding NtrC family response regulator
MQTRPRLCLVEDDAIMGESLCDRFDLEGFDCDWHKNAATAIAKIEKTAYAAIISDIRLPDASGEEMFQQLLTQKAFLPPWIFITAYGSIDRAVALLKQGAADYITKPFDLDVLIDKLRRLCLAPSESVRSQHRQPRLGLSPVMRKIEEVLPRLAKQAATILLTGESGVGKEVVAREIQALDAKIKDQPFVAVNCGALTETLLESELFGHEKGAFTGAVRTKKGVFEQADGGTLFLDEIGDMPPVMQVKLLRVIQERQVVRVGGEHPIAVNLRLICATHRDLQKLVEQGDFREDLFYRIHVIHLKIPPLRERREDILWFAYKFLGEFGNLAGECKKQFLPAAEQAMLNYAWPGNLRELRHAIERACILTTGKIIGIESLFGNLEIPMEEESIATYGLRTFLQSCERNYITNALEQHDGHIAETAISLGISRKNLWEKMKKLRDAGG